MQAGIDIVSDGEQPRVGFSMYIPLRMEGFGGESVRPTPRDLDDFPLYRERLRERRGRYNRIANPPKAIRAVAVRNHDIMVRSRLRRVRSQLKWLSDVTLTVNRSVSAELTVSAML